MADENENENEKLAVDVGTFVAMLLERQKEFEDEMRAKLALTNARVEEIFRLQQNALRDATDTIKAVIEKEDEVASGPWDGIEQLMYGEHRPIQSIRDEIAFLARELAEAVAFNEAIRLAYEERTGEELPDGGEYSRADRVRAEEIIELYPTAEKEHT